MGLFDRFRSDDETDAEPEFEEVTETREVRKVIENKRATIGIKGEDERFIEYDVYDNGEFKRAEGWSWRTYALNDIMNSDGSDNLLVDVREWETVLEVNHDYLKYIDPAWEHEQTLVTEVELTYEKRDDGYIRNVEAEKVDAWVEEGDTTES
jgi:hypothetical protein